MALMNNLVHAYNKRTMHMLTAQLLLEPVIHDSVNGVTNMATKGTKKSTRRAQTPENETPSQCFARLAQGRTNKAVKAISLLAQLTGSAYESTEIQRRAIVIALEASVEQVKDTFAGKSKASDSFKLPE